MAGLARTNSTATTQPWWLTEVQRLQREDGARPAERAAPSPVHSDDDDHESIDITETDNESESDPEPTTSDEEFIATSDSEEEADDNNTWQTEHGQTLPGP